jgi:hypothetical protein
MEKQRGYFLWSRNWIYRYNLRNIYASTQALAPLDIEENSDNTLPTIQSDSGGKIDIFEGDIIGHWENKFHINMCLTLNRYQNRAVRISRLNSVRFLFVGLDEGRSLQKKRGYKRRTARSHFGCCCPHKVTWRSTQTKKTRSSHKSCKVHWGWRWDFRTFVVNCNKFVISVLKKLSFIH